MSDESGGRGQCTLRFPLTVERRVVYATFKRYDCRMRKYRRKSMRKTFFNQNNNQDCESIKRSVLLRVKLIFQTL